MKITYHFKETYKFITKRFAIMVIKYLFGIQEPEKPFDGKVDSIIILGQERFGDLIVLTPLIKKLRQIYPDSSITLLGVTEMISFLYDDPNLNRVVNIKRTKSLIRREILRDHYDIFFNTKDHPSFTFLFLTARIRARYKIGIYHQAHIGYFNYMHYFEDAIPTAEKNMAPLYFMNIPFKKDDLRPYLPDKAPSDEIRKFAAVLKGINPLGINLSASNPGKEWPLAYWEKLLAEINLPFVILAMPDDAEKKERLERTHKNVHPSPPTRTLLDAGYLISHLRLLITTDTALVHVASCSNTPAIVLYRLERDMKKFPPFSDHSRIHISPTTNLADILPNEVIESTREFLKNT